MTLYISESTEWFRQAGLRQTTATFFIRVSFTPENDSELGTADSNGKKYNLVGAKA